MKIMAQGDPITYEVNDPAEACRLYRQDMTAALIGVVTHVTDYERAQRAAESVRLFEAERKRLTEENKALLQWLDFATAYIAKAVADGQMEACAVPASLALGRLREVLAKQP